MWWIAIILIVLIALGALAYRIRNNRRAERAFQEMRKRMVDYRSIAPDNRSDSIDDDKFDPASVYRPRVLSHGEAIEMVSY